MKWFLIVVLLSALQIRAFSQEIAPASSTSAAFKNAVAFYNDSFSTQLHLYNGKEYLGYGRRFTHGQPYFMTDTWSKGTVTYEGTSYADVSILYDLVTDEIVILNYYSVSKIQLIKERVSNFSFAGHSFINIPRDSLMSAGISGGYYDVLAAGKITLLARRTKQIQTIARQVIETEVLNKDHYYIKRNNSYITVNTRRGFLNELADKKKEIQQFIKQNKLNYRKDRENTMIKAVEYYNALTK